MSKLLGTKANSLDNRDVWILNREYYSENFQFGNKITCSDNQNIRIIGIRIIGRVLYSDLRFPKQLLCKSQGYPKGKSYSHFGTLI